MRNWGWRIFWWSCRPSLATRRFDIWMRCRRSSRKWGEARRSAMDRVDRPPGKKRCPREKVIALADLAQQHLRAQDAAAHAHHGEDFIPAEIDQLSANQVLVASDNLLAGVEPRQLGVEV